MAREYDKDGRGRGGGRGGIGRNDLGPADHSFSPEEIRPYYDL